MADEDTRAELERLRAENAALKKVSEDIRRFIDEHADRLKTKE